MASRPWFRFLLGAAAGVVGLAPWLIHGMRLPLQNLWATAIGPSGSPLVLLPFSQYAIDTIAALLVAGGALGGLAVRVRPSERPSRNRVLVLVGLLVVQAVAVLQTAAVVGGGLQHRTESGIYLALLVAGSLVSIALGGVVLLLLSGRHRAGVVVAVALFAVLLPSWLDAFLAPPVTLFAGPSWLLSVARWLAPIAVGAAVAWAGLRTPGRIAAAVFGGLALWIGPALITALVNSVGTRVYARYPGEMARAGAQVFVMALGSLDLVPPPLLVAAAVAAAGIVARSAALRRAGVAER